MSDAPGGRPAIVAVVVGYLLISLAVTWPLAAHLTTSLPADYGDPVFVAWVMAWVSRHLTAMLGGDLGAWSAMWEAPIFAPEHGTLTYSEHFLGQALPLLPVWWATANPLLLYNLAFVLAFVLTGVGAHSLTRRITGSHLAGAVAGLTFAFGGYRMIYSLSHLHTLSIYWWTLALWALDVYAESRSRRALVIAAVCLIGQNLSSSYFMAFTPPFTAAYCVWALSRYGRLRDRRAWIELAVCGAVSVIVMLPIVATYLSVSASLGFARSLDEVQALSVVWLSYVLAAPWLLPLAALAIAGVVSSLVAGRQGRPTDVSALWLLALAACGFVLAMGPELHLGGVTVPGPYGLLYHYVPGFSGLRVASRYVAIALLFVSVLAGAAASAAWRAQRLAVRVTGLATIVALTAMVTAQAWASPFRLDVALTSTDRVALPPEYLRPLATTPRLYQFVKTLPRDAVIVELPFGDIGYDIRYTYFTLAHERRVLNGYSGVLPPSYLARAKVLAEPLSHLDASWAALAPATHVVVHGAAWPDDTGAQLRAWLESRGARVVVADIEGAWIYALPDR